MDIYRIDKLTDDMMNLSDDKFYEFLKIILNKDLCELFRAQSIRDMMSLKSITVDDLIQILDYDIVELHPLQKALGYISTDGKFHLRLGFRKLLERLLLLVNSKKDLFLKDSNMNNDCIENNLLTYLIKLWKQASTSSNDVNVPILIPWIKNIYENMKKSKNNFSYDNHIQQFALLLFIFGGRNCYEFLRMNLHGALPHVSNLETLIRNHEVKMIECEFRFKLLKEYLSSHSNQYVFCSEDSTSSICRIDYNAQTNSFVGFSSPLIDGLPQPNFFQTDDFEELKMWFHQYDKSNFINIHMIQSITPNVPPLILSVYGSNNKATAIDVVKRWIHIYEQCLHHGVRVIGFSADGDSRYLKAMRLCAGFFAELSNLNLSKYNDIFEIKLPDAWSWFLMREQQVLLFMQDPVHLATKFRNRLLSDIASLKMGAHTIDIQHLFDLIELQNKLEHNLIKSDINPKDRQNFASCIKISSDMVLKLLYNNTKYKGTYVYLSLLRLIISSLIEKSTSIEERLYQIWTVLFTCRFWRAWIKHFKLTRKNSPDNSLSLKQLKQNSFITTQTYWCIEINAHTLLYMILLIMNQKLPIDAINTYMFNSQTCANTFRIARSLSGAYSSIVNFSVKSFMKRSEKISIVNSIKGRNSQAGGYQFVFPQHHKFHKETYYIIDQVKHLNLTQYDIERIIEKAFESAKGYITYVNMAESLKEKKLYSLFELSQFTKFNLNRSSKIIDYIQNHDVKDYGNAKSRIQLSDNNKYDNDTDNDDDDDENDEDNEDNEENNDSGSDEEGDEGEQEEDEDNVLSNDLDDVQRKSFEGCRIYDKINSQHINKYFRFRIGNSYKYIHKQTACWLLSNDKNHLSSDRLMRVRNS